MKFSKWMLLGALLLLMVAVWAPAAAATPPIISETGFPGSPVAPAADGTVTLSVYDPTGPTEITQLFAPRLSDLNGKTICEVSMGIWEADRTFPAIRALLQKQFPAIKMVTFDQLPRLIENKDVAGLEDAVKKAGCQGVILGNAG